MWKHSNSYIQSSLIYTQKPEDIYGKLQKQLQILFSSSYQEMQSVNPPLNLSQCSDLHWLVECKFRQKKPCRFSLALGSLPAPGGEASASLLDGEPKWRETQ